MGLFDLFGQPADPATYQAPRGIPSPDEPRELVLYQYASCPFCARVLRALDRLDLGDAVTLQDTLRDREARRVLVEKTHRSTVPCLFIDGVPFHESADIIDWLGAYAVRGATAG